MRGNNQIEVTTVAGHWHGCDRQCRLMVSAMDNEETSGNGCSMDAVMVYGDEVA
jgi:hypothetical protein